MKEKIAWSMIFAAGGFIVLLAAYKLHALSSADPSAAHAASSLQSAGQGTDAAIDYSGASSRGRERPFVTVYRERPPAPPRGESEGTTQTPVAVPASTPVSEAALQAAVTTPIAEAALYFVGIEDSAELIWLAAVKDPDRPAVERQALIEGLSQIGFVDPANPTDDEYDLIENRIAIIEDVGPTAMDDVNRLAFQAAYRRLLAMRDQLDAAPAN